MRPIRSRLVSMSLPIAVAVILVGAPASRWILADPAPSDPPRDAATLLAGRAVGPTPMIDDLRALCDEIGGRPTGSAANDRAVDWAVGRFRAAGVESVTTEPFPAPGLWLGGSAEAACLSPEPFPLRAVAAASSPSTPGGREIEARLVDAGYGQPAEFARLGQSAAGAIALVRSNEMRTFQDLFGEYLRIGPMMEGAKNAKVAAVLMMSNRPRGLLYRHPASLERSFAPLPVAIVSREHALRLARLLEKGEVRVKLSVASRTGGPYDARNVVAEIRGREKPEEIVLLGAHIDSWDLGTGAEDDGVNAALVIDVARGMKALGLTPRRTIRFVLFNGEELGMWGSAAYAKSHADEMDRHVAVVVFDTGSGRTTGFLLNGRGELLAPVASALGSAFGLGPFTLHVGAIDGTDNFDFILQGVPNLVAAQDEIPYLPDYHAESDVFERVDQREAKANAAIASALVWNLAEAEGRPAKRQTRAEIEKLLYDAKLEDQMKGMGQWKDWIAGRRGVKP